MSLAQLVPIALSASIALIVFSVGLATAPGDITGLLRRPGLLFRSLLAMNVVMPALAAGIAVVFNLRPEVETALILLAVSPVPPVLPGKHAKAGGNASYSVGLLALSAVLAIVTVPLSVTIIGRLLGHDLHVPIGVVARVLAVSVLAPLVAGLLVRRVAPAFAERFGGTIGKIGTLVLVLGALAIVVSAWSAIVGRVGDFTLVAVTLFTVAGLVVGHLLGGPDEDDRSVLALSAACRHPGVAMAVAGAILTAEQKGVVSAAVLLCVLVGAVVTTPYVKWRRAHAAPAPAAA